MSSPEEFGTGISAGFLAFLPLLMLGSKRQLPPALSAAISLAFFSVPAVLLLRFSLEGLRWNALWWYLLAAAALVAVMMGLVFAEFALLRRPMPDEQTVPLVRTALRVIIAAAAAVFLSSIVWLHVRVLAPLVTDISVESQAAPRLR